MLKDALNIWRKEMRDILRDRKSLRTALFAPIFMATFFALISAFVGNLGTQPDNAEILEPQHIATIGEQHLPADLLEILAELAIQIDPYTNSVEQLEVDVRNEDVEMGLIVPADFMQNIEGGKPALPIIIEASSTSMTELGVNNRLELAFDQYSDTVLAKRLTERGIDKDLLTPLQVETRDVTFNEDANQASRAGGLIAAFYVPLLLAIAIGSGGISTAIDTTAGERERGTLESLLLTPAGERGIFIGKTAKVMTMTLIPVTLTLITFIAVSRFGAPLIWKEYISPSISGVSILLSIMLCLPFMLAVSLFQMILALRAKSAKDAQSVSPVSSFLVMFPMGAGAFMQPDNLLFHLIPGFGTTSVISKMILSQPYLSFIPYVLLSSIVLAAIAVWIGARMFDREKLLYGT